MFIAQTPASALVFNHSSELCILVYVIYDLVINDKQNPKPEPRRVSHKTPFVKLLT